MPVPASPVSWVGSLLWLVALTAAAFGITWVAANRMNMRRSPYVAVLTVVTVGFAVGYVAWSGIGAVDLLTSRWAWGLPAAPLAGAFTVLGMRKLPVVRRLHGRDLAVAIGWEGVVYGIAEGLLLSTLPVLMTWQLVHSLGWTGPGGAVARWTLPMVASVVVIVVHHLGYWEYRNRLLLPITIGCGLLSVGYLATASPIAPTLGHVLAHASCLQHGAELPPHPHDAPSRSDPVGASESR